MIAIRRARPTDAAAIGAVHVAAWRSAYPGILPEAFLARLSVSRQAAHYDRSIRAGVGVHVATVSGLDLGGEGGAPRIVGFVTGSPVGNIDRLRRHDAPERTLPEAGRRHETTRETVHALGEGEIETLYVLDDWRERGIGRRLMRAAAGHLTQAGCRSAYLWVLRENPSRWFYTRLGGRPVMEATIRVGGTPVIQTAYSWSPIERLAEATSTAT